MTTIKLDAARELLQRHRLDPVHAEPLARVLGRGFMREVPMGSIICEEGKPATELLILLEGSVTVRKKDNLGVSKDLVSLTAPAMFGHMALVANTPRTATCIASEACTLVGLDTDLFEILLELSGPQGEAIRWLLVSSMLMQHNTGTQGIQRQMIRAREARLEDGELTILTASLQGW